MVYLYEDEKISVLIDFCEFLQQNLQKLLTMLHVWKFLQPMEKRFNQIKSLHQIAYIYSTKQLYPYT
jgi:hypothetical protein